VLLDQVVLKVLELPSRRIEESVSSWGFHQESKLHRFPGELLLFCSELQLEVSSIAQ